MSEQADTSERAAAFATLTATANTRLAYIQSLNRLADRLTADPMGWYLSAAAELRHIATTNLTGAE